MRWFPGGQNRHEQHRHIGCLECRKQNSRDGDQSPWPQYHHGCACSCRKAEQLQRLFFRIPAKRGLCEVKRQLCRVMLPPDPCGVLDGTPRPGRSRRIAIAFKPINAGLAIGRMVRINTVPLIVCHVTNNGLATRRKALLRCKVFFVHHLTQVAERKACTSLSSCALSSGKWSAERRRFAFTKAVAAAASAKPGIATSDQ